MPQKEGRDEAIRRAKERLEDLLGAGAESIEARCVRLGLPSPSSGIVDFRAFGSPARLDLATLALTGADGAELSQADRILIYHYLECESALSAGGDPVSFRDFPGGAFYWEPFRSRTCLPLARRYGDDLASGAPELRAALGRFDWTELALRDFAIRVHGFGSLYLIIVAYAADEEQDADVNVLFEGAARRAFCAEDAVAFASRICLALL